MKIDKLAPVRSDTGNESTEGHLSELSDSLCRPAGVCTAAPHRMVGEDQRAWSVRRAEFYYHQLDALADLHQDARCELLSESCKHFAVQLLRLMSRWVRSAQLCWSL
jgi:hypothetical protein